MRFKKWRLEDALPYGREKADALCKEDAFLWTGKTIPKCMHVIKNIFFFFCNIRSSENGDFRKTRRRHHSSAGAKSARAPHVSAVMNLVG